MTANKKIKSVEQISGDICEIVCVHCNRQLEVEFQNKTHLECDNCLHKFPVVKDIPVLVDNIDLFFAEAVLTYKAHIKGRERRINNLKEEMASKPFRQNPLENLIRAMKSNVLLVKEMLASIMPLVSVETLIEFSLNFEILPEFSNYLNDFYYLRRDWAWLPEGENQVTTIKKELIDSIRSAGNDLDSALVVGAGLGRIACELTTIFDRVYATDKSYSIAYFFKKLFEEDIYFYEINNIDVASSRNMMRHLKASFTPPSNKKVKNQEFIKKAEKVNYFVSDVTNLPLENQSLSAFISIYFTDVVALKLYFTELVRVLKPNGLFVHFGPLAYAFESITERLFPDDIRTIFIDNGFEIIKDTFVLSSHIESSVSLQTQTFNNWFFIAKKIAPKGMPNEVLLKPGTILAIKGKLSFSVNGQLSTEGIDQKTMLTFQNGHCVENADTVFDVLKYVNGKNTVADIIDLLSKQYDLSSGSEQLLYEKLKELIQDKIIYIQKS